MSKILKFWASQKIKTLLNILNGYQFPERTPLRIVTTANAVDLSSRSMIVLYVM